MDYGLRTADWLHALQSTLAVGHAFIFVECQQQKHGYLSHSINTQCLLRVYVYVRHLHDCARGLIGWSRLMILRIWSALQEQVFTLISNPDMNAKRLKFRALFSVY